MLHPIKSIDQITNEYRDFLMTEFRAKDPSLKNELEKQIDMPGFIAGEAFYQVHRPFKSGKKWSELNINDKLAAAIAQISKSENAYLHQASAIDYLTTGSPESLVVTTGTGSGKTECFLVPVINNAINDSIAFKKSGLTAILLYPMNALANDQLLRIQTILDKIGLSSVVSVEKYDRGTTQAQRENLRKNPPHILLTNYMMLEYLLVRPADRDDIFANHRCKFIVLDEVHTYRGALGSNIALLVRRLTAHLKNARQDYNNENKNDIVRFPKFVYVGTSATIKSGNGNITDKMAFIKERNEEISDFFSKLTSANKDGVLVVTEELQEMIIPEKTTYSKEYCDFEIPGKLDEESLKKGIEKLAGCGTVSSLSEAVQKCKIIWDLNRILIEKTMPVTELAVLIKKEVPERNDWPLEKISSEIETALILGGALPDDMAGSLKLKVHKFFRGGWQFYRCVDPKCAKLYPKGEEKCECGHGTAPLYLCRTCGADYLRFVGDNEPKVLRPSNNRMETFEWLLYNPSKFENIIFDSDDDSDDNENTGLSDMISARVGTTMKSRNILYGSFDPSTFSFDESVNTNPVKVVLAPARNKCLCCGSTAGSRSIISPVSLGTSAAVKILGEGTIESLKVNRLYEEDNNQKERLLIFSDSRQDAAHQARFIRFASRYDRFRRRLYYMLKKNGVLSIQRVVELLSAIARENKDNPYIPEGAGDFLPQDMKMKINAYEEAPLLDEISVNAVYRATITNLGLVNVFYDDLEKYIAEYGKELLEKFNLPVEKLSYLCRVLLDKIRTFGCLNRDLLRYHPNNSYRPEYYSAAEWERKVKNPKALPLDDNGNPAGYIDIKKLPAGIKVHNPWSSPNAKGKKPIIQKIFEKLVVALSGTNKTDESLLLELFNFLKRGYYLVDSEIFGFSRSCKMLQVNYERVYMKLAEESNRFKCGVCGIIQYNAVVGFPCPYCHGKLEVFKNEIVDKSKYVKRIKLDSFLSLDVAEHTAQVSTDERASIEDRFKDGNKKLNVLACSPTLEMGIDIGGLDAIILRNIPPRPDNYAQRGGRAGRRQRIGLVIGYARSSPHDQYFYEHPEEMIFGEVRVPQIALGNKDVIYRHLNAIAFGAANPGLMSKMADYIDPKGDLVKEAIDNLLNAIKEKNDYTVNLAKSAWGLDILEKEGISENELRKELEGLSTRIFDLFNRISRQIKDLRGPLESYYNDLEGKHLAIRSSELIARILGISSNDSKDKADDRSSGYPMRRFAEFGILPGYEFPNEPATLRLLGDSHEEEPISVNRQFGIAQYQPKANVYARNFCWEVIGIDVSSPWNPQKSDAGEDYQICPRCALRYKTTSPKCPRCSAEASAAKAITAVNYGGFIAKRKEMPVLDEEDRTAARNNVSGNPQWNGITVGRWATANDWKLVLSKEEKILWINEGGLPKGKDLKSGNPLLHESAKGFIICPSCGRIVNAPLADKPNSKGRKKLSADAEASAKNTGHALKCEYVKNVLNPIALYTESHCEILRLLVMLPENINEEDVKTWGCSLGYALRNGMRHRYSMDGSEIEFIMEGPWLETGKGYSYKHVSLTFIDQHIGGSGYLQKIAQEFKEVAADARAYLEHKDCETACYRCLKSYNNQRFHQFLNWPRVISDLEVLASEPVKTLSLKLGDNADPMPWLEAYKEGVGSPLELKFLRLFEKKGIKVEKQVPVPHDKPISVADFAIIEGDKRIAIYIDSAAFHVGQNLRRDMYIRKRLVNMTPKWKVVELRAKDLNDADKIIAMLS